MRPQEDASLTDFGEARLDALQRHAFDYFLSERSKL